MTHDHASFFSGVGGLDLGLERAGWRTVSFSEIDPYASAVLAERWPGVVNLGDITDLANERPSRRPLLDAGRIGPDGGCSEEHRSDGPYDGRPGDWRTATLWTGGFPCQDLSVAGKRRGMVEGARSNLAHSFLDLVERHRPPAILLENVPGLLSSHRGRDMAVLVGRMAELGYGVAYRILDARHFGVPQRRRRVFILGLRSEADDPTGRIAAERAAAVLAVGTRCERHPATGGEAGPGAAGGAPNSPDGIVGQALSAKWSKQAGGPAGDEYHNLVSAPADPGRVRAPHGLASGLDDSDELAATLTAPDTRHRVVDGKRQDGSRLDRIPTIVQSLDTKRGGPDDNEAQAGHLIAFVKRGRAQSAHDGETWGEGDVMPTLNSFDVGDVRTTAAVLSPTLRVGPAKIADGGPGDTVPIIEGIAGPDDPLLPLGLDSNRYRCCGNGVVANVAEWLGRRLIEAMP